VTAEPTDEELMLADIRGNPLSDLHRLAFADWLEDRRDPPDYRRAAFIRAQIGGVMDMNASPTLMQLVELEDVLGVQPHQMSRTSRAGVTEVTAGGVRIVYRRGFPDEVQAAWTWLRGRECDQCDGPVGHCRRGLCAASYRMGGCECDCERCRAVMGDFRCDTCAGTGHIPGRLRDLVRRFPIARVTCTTAIIFPSGGNETYYVGNLGEFPSKYWLRLNNHRSEQAARDALSEVFLEEAREQPEGVP